MTTALFYAGWLTTVASLVGVIWILAACLQHKKQSDVSGDKSVENGKAVRRKNKSQRGHTTSSQDNVDSDTLPNGRPKSHDQRVLPDIPHPTTKSVAVAAPANVTTSHAGADEDDETDEGHYDVISRQTSVMGVGGPAVIPPSLNNHSHNPYERVAALHGSEDAESDSTYAPVGSETYAGVRDLPASVLALEDPDLDPDPNYAGIGDGGAVLFAANREHLRRAQLHNYESVEATYAQVIDRSQQRTGAAPEAEPLGTAPATLVVTPELGGVYDMNEGVAGGKEARYSKVTAREPLADLRRRQAEEKAEAERRRDAAYATVGDCEVETGRPLVQRSTSHRTSQYSDMYAEIGDVRADSVNSRVMPSTPAPPQAPHVPEPPPVYTLKQLTAYSRHDDAAEPGYSSIEVHQSKGRSLPRTGQSVFNPTDGPVYSVVDPKRPRDKAVHGDHLLQATNGHAGPVEDSMYARVNKQARRQQSTRAGSDGAAAAMRGADWQPQNWNVGRSAAASVAGGDVAVTTRPGSVLSHSAAASSSLGRPNAIVSARLDDEMGYSRCEDVDLVVVSAVAVPTAGVVAGNGSASAAVPSDYDPNYEVISNFAVTGGQRRGEVDLGSNLATAQRLTTAVHGHVANGNDGHSRHAANGDVAVWLKREHIYQDIDEVHLTHNSGPSASHNSPWL